MTTTLNRIKSHGPCPDGWYILMRYLGKTEADDEPLAITTILDSNGLEHALWALQAVDGYDREKRLYAVWCARQVQHLLTDPRGIAAIDVAERYALGEATLEELLTAADAAAYAAADAAHTAAGAAATFALRAAARAARAAAYAAAWNAAWAGARDVARAAQVKQLRRVCEEIAKAEERHDKNANETNKGNQL